MIGRRHAIGRRAQRRFTRLVDKIMMPVTPDTQALCDAVAQRLDRPIHLLALPLPADVPCGLVITTPNTHYVAHDNQTSPLHQRHIVAHELGHLLAGHAAQSILDTDVARLLMPTLNPSVVQAVLTRAPGYDGTAEREAELIADLLWRRTIRLWAEPARDVNPSDVELVRRIRRSLGGE
jgi:hypothetical protein